MSVMLPVAAIAGLQATSTWTQIKSAQQSERLAKQQAENARIAGEYEAKRIKRQAKHNALRMRDASQRAAAQSLVEYGVHGLDASGGSAVEVLSGQAAAHERSMLDMERDAEYRARQARYGGRYSAGQYDLRADAARQRQGSIIRGKMIGLGSSLLAAR